MSESIFTNFPELDSAYLDDAYGSDAETAAIVFEQYLQDLPGNLNALKESLYAGDAAVVRQLLHKQKPGFSYVGLTDLTAEVQQLEAACQSPEDLKAIRGRVEQVLSRMEITRPVIEKALRQLQQQ